jgi:hypothetical protein
MKFCSLLSFFCSLLVALSSTKETKKRGEFESRKNSVLFFDTLHTKEKRKKKFITLRRKKRFLRKRFEKSLLLLERTLRALESKELFSFSIVVLLYSKQ